jgi:hypothetical protein
MSANPKSILNIAIVGLSVANMVALRQHVRHIIPESQDINWANMAEPELDLLIIDTDFVQARSIQKILSYRPVPVLKIARNSGCEGKLIDDTLHLPISRIDELSAWVQDKLLQAEPVATAAAIDTAPRVTAVTPDRHLFERLHSKTLGMVKLIDARGVVGIADTNQELFWTVDDRRNHVTIDHTLGLTHSTRRDLQDVHTMPMDLRQWLWQTVWHSPFYASLVSPADHVRLLSWPQPAADQDRRDVLRMSAYLQQQSSSIHQVAEHTKMPLSRVQHFASALIAAGLAETVPEEQIVIAQQPNPVKESAGWRGLLSKLRNQFGL